MASWPGSNLGNYTPPTYIPSFPFSFNYRWDVSFFPPKLARKQPPHPGRAATRDACVVIPYRPRRQGKPGTPCCSPGGRGRGSQPGGEARVLFLSGVCWPLCQDQGPCVGVTLGMVPTWVRLPKGHPFHADLSATP